MATAPATAVKTKASRQRELLDRSQPAGKHVWKLLEQIDASEDPESVPPAKDRAAAARAAIDAWVMDRKDPQLLLDAKIRFAHWLETDPKAAVTYWNGSGGAGIPALAALDEIARPYLETVGLGELSAWFLETESLQQGAASEALIGALAKTIAGSQDVAVLESLMAEMPSWISGRLISQSIRMWPLEKIDSAEDFVRKYPSSQVLLEFVRRLKGPDCIQWIQRELREEGTLAQTLRESGLATNAVSRARGASVQERLKVMAELEAARGNPASRPLTASHLVAADLSGWLVESDRLSDGAMADWRHRLRQGEISARQVMDEAKRALPAVVAEQPDEFRKALFKTLAAIQPTSAMELISDLPLQQRETTLLDAAQGVAGQADPQHLIELLSQMPPSLASKPNDRFQVWVRAAAPSYSKYGDSYVAWVTAMPEGIERDWALSGLSSHFLADDPAKAAAIKSLKTMPPGWRPAQ